MMSFQSGSLHSCHLVVLSARRILISFPSRCQRRDVYGAWEQFLGLEHSDNAPKRAYAVNQNRHTYEKPVKIEN